MRQEKTAKDVYASQRIREDGANQSVAIAVQQICEAIIDCASMKTVTPSSQQFYILRDYSIVRGVQCLLSCLHMTISSRLHGQFRSLKSQAIP